MQCPTTCPEYRYAWPELDTNEVKVTTKLTWYRFARPTKLTWYRFAPKLVGRRPKSGQTPDSTGSWRLRPGQPSRFCIRIPVPTATVRLCTFYEEANSTTTGR